MGPLIIGLAAGALGFVLGNLGKKKEEPAPQPAQPDPRLDQIMMSQARQEALLGRILQNQESMMSCFGNPAAMNALFGGAQSPGQFFAVAERLTIAMPGRGPC